MGDVVAEGAAREDSEGGAIHIRGATGTRMAGGGEVFGGTLAPILKGPLRTLRKVDARCTRQLSETSPPDC